MSDLEPITARRATEMALQESGIQPDFIGIEDVRRHSSRLFQMLRRREPSVIVVEAPSVESLDVMALRWIFPTGITPLILCPSSINECVEMAGTAAAAARLVKAPVFMLVEDNLELDDEDSEPALAAPDLSLDEPPPSNADEPENEFTQLEESFSRPPRGLRAGTFDRCPEALGKPEWLVLTYGASHPAARSAVSIARDEGQRVNLLSLRMLWPVPESEILKAAMGVKHVVVAEPNLGQYALEVRRLLPELPVIHAGQPLGPVTSEFILKRLRKSPRCC